MCGKNYFFLNKSLMCLLAALAVSLVSPFWALAAEVPVENATKLRVKNVEIRGAKVRLPIPDGYEEMRRADDPDTYDWLVKVYSDERTLPLAFLIHSDDKVKLQRGESVNLRYGCAFADERSWDAVILRNTIDKFDMGYFEEFITDICEGGNEISIQREEDIDDWQFIHKSMKSVSYSSVRQNKISKLNFKHSKTSSYIILDRKVCILNLYEIVSI